jgi:hypothetical protein
MFLTSNLFDKMEPEEFDGYIKVLSGLQARLLVDDQNEDHRRSRKVLNAKYLAAKDSERLVESLRAYRELLEDPPSDESETSDR